jgi:hypothetical protein
MYVTLDWTSAQFVRYGKYSNNILTVVTLVATNAKEATTAPIIRGATGSDEPWAG